MYVGSGGMDHNRVTIFCYMTTRLYKGIYQSIIPTYMYTYVGPRRSKEDDERQSTVLYTCNVHMLDLNPLPTFLVV